MQDVPGYDGSLGDGESEWPRVGRSAPDAPGSECWPLADVAGYGDDDPTWKRL